VMHVQSGRKNEEVMQPVNQKKRVSENANVYDDSTNNFIALQLDN